MSVGALSFILIFAAASADHGPVDPPGCHENLERTEYLCDAGPLAGARYPNRAAAERALAARESLKPGRRSTKDPLNVVLWSFDAVPADPERVASALVNADLVVLRGLNGGTREQFLNKLSVNLDARTRRHHCRGQRDGQTFVWREEDVAVVKPDGSLVESCGARAHDLTSAGSTVFEARASKHLFTVGASALGWPALAFDTKPPVAADKQGFRVAVKASPAGAWTHDLFVVDSETKTLRELFPDLGTRDVERRVGHYAPMVLHLSFTEPDQATLQMVKREAKPRREIASEPVLDSYPGAVNTNNLSVPEDDLEFEERASRPKSTSKSGKSRKSR